MLFVILYAMVYSTLLLNNYVLTTELNFHLIGIVSLISFFYRLRVYDELKDYKIDVINHPNRVLQSGKINLKSLVFVSFILILFELYWIISIGIVSIITWLIAFVYSLLMRYEFFIPSVLKKSLFVYAFSHMIIMPLIIFWIWTSLSYSLNVESSIIYLLVLSLCSGFAFEIARKIFAKENEMETKDSYSKELGLKLSQLLVIILSTLLIGVLCLFFYKFQMPIYYYIFNAIIYLWIVTSYIKTIKLPSEILLRKNEKKVSIMMLASYMSIIIYTIFN